MQHRRRRLTTAAIALALTSGAAVATGAVTAATASAADSTGVSIPSPDASVDRGVKILASGLNGVLYQEEGTAGYLWTNTSNSGTKTVTALAGSSRRRSSAGTTRTTGSGTGAPPRTAAP